MCAGAALLAPQRACAFVESMGVGAELEGVAPSEGGLADLLHLIMVPLMVFTFVQLLLSSLEVSVVLR